MSTDEATTFRTEYWLSRAEKVALWGEGPWLDEPDTFEWNFESIRCFAVRNDEMGNWCGYIALQSGHPWHGQNDESLGTHERGCTTEDVRRVEQGQRGREA